MKCVAELSTPAGNAYALSPEVALTSSIVLRLEVA